MFLESCNNSLKTILVPFQDSHLKLWLCIYLFIRFIIIIISSSICVFSPVLIIYYPFMYHFI